MLYPLELVDGNAKLLDGTYVAGWVLFQQTVRKAIDKAEKGIRLNEMCVGHGTARRARERDARQPTARSLRLT